MKKIKYVIYKKIKADAFGFKIGEVYKEASFSNEKDALRFFDANYSVKSDIDLKFADYWIEEEEVKGVN